MTWARAFHEICAALERLPPEVAEMTLYQLKVLVADPRELGGTVSMTPEEARAIVKQQGAARAARKLLKAFGRGLAR